MPVSTGFCRLRCKSVVSFCNCVRLKKLLACCLRVCRWCFLVHGGVVFCAVFQQVMGPAQSRCVAEVVFVLN